MTDVPSPDEIAEFLVRLERLRADDATGWGVAVYDTESEEVSSFYGPLESAEQALALAADFDRCPHTGLEPDDGSPGWRHFVVPIFAPPSK